MPVNFPNSNEPFPELRTKFANQVRHLGEPIRLIMPNLADSGQPDLAQRVFAPDRVDVPG